VAFEREIKKTRAYLCLECGVCTGSCPVSRFNPAYSPRMVVEKALLLEEGESIHDREMWSCLTCGTCDQRCPSTVDFTGFMRSLREKARRAGEEGVCTHAETLSAIGALQLMPGFRRSTSWLGKGVKTRKRGKVYYFGGCLPFLDVVFRDIGFEGNRIANTIAKKAIEAVKATGAKQVVFSCPEGYRMFKDVYPDLVRKAGLEPVHILTLLAESSEKLRFTPTAKKVTYQDPCRLAKGEDIIDEPRSLLKAVPDLELVEMKRSGKDSVCCGSSNWVNCSRVNKKIQVERLEEAISTGAEALITACPKCNIHLRCALHDGDASGEIDIVDLITLLADSLGGGTRGT